MRELLPEIERWQQAGKPVALATVVQVHGSALRPTGSKMAVSAAGDIAGSVSGGCVEGAVFEVAQQVLKTRQPQLVTYGIADESAWEVGLACGGRVQIYVEALDTAEEQSQICSTLKHCLETGQLVAQATGIAGPHLGDKLLIWPDGHVLGQLEPASLTDQVLGQASKVLETHTPARLTFELGEATMQVFMDVFPPLPRLIIVGAVHIAIPLAAFAKTLGFCTIVLDARSAFATRERFPHVDELVVEWPSTAIERLRPDEATYVVVVTHDDKLDIPALQAALASPARYIGVLGSASAHAKRIQALKQAGVADSQIARLHAPIGLEVGAVGPQEIALAIMAEVVAASHGRRARRRVP